MENVFINVSILCGLVAEERFRMVRVGRAEAMHPKASDISSQQLATRELARIHAEQPAAPAGLEEEVIASWIN